jgi:hypothetical protein
MVPDIWVYRTANKLIAQHGTDALNEADRLLNVAMNRRDADRVLLIFRVRGAIRALQAPPRGPLH